MIFRKGAEIYMSKKATEFQRKAMSRFYRGKEIFKPLNMGWVDEDVACVRKWVANIFFYHNPNAPYDAYDESDDTVQNAKSGYLPGVG